MAERNVSLIEDSITGLKTSNGIKISSVTGGTSTDNAIVRFDGTTGNVQNSGVVIDDSNNVGIGNINPDNAISVYSNPLLYAGENYRSNITLYDSSTVGAGVGGGIGFGGNYNGTSNKTTFATISVAKDNSSTSDFGASLIFKTRGAVTAPIERMRIDSSGVLSVLNTIRADLPGNGASFIGSGAGSNFQVQHNINGYATLVNSGGGLILSTQDTEKMRIDSAGNIGIGVTPSAWGSINRVIDTGNQAGQLSIYGRLDGANGSGITQNAYRDASNVWKYKANGYALLEERGAGAYYWYIAPSGTAGSPIAWTDAMTLGSNGNLLVGTETDNGADKLQVNGSISATSFVGALTGNAGTATTLQTARTIGAGGDVTGTATSFNGSANITIPMTLANSGVTAGTYSKMTVDAKGRVTAGFTQTMEDIPDATLKRSVKAATTANITLSAPQTIDGVALVAGDRVLVKNQTTTSQNGIYAVAAAAWTRALDADSASEIASALVAVDTGTVNGGKLFDNDFKTTDTLGTTAMVWNANLDDGALLTSGSTSVGIVKYNGTTAAAGQFDGGTTTPTGSTRLNYGGDFYPTNLNLLGSNDTTSTSSHVFVETASDGYVRPKTLGNFKTEMFTSPALSGTPTAPTAAVGTNTTQVATTAFVNAEIANDAVPRVTSTDNAIVRFNGTTGAVQNSNILIDSSGNLNITGTGKRITGDFSNATHSNRTAFQTSVLNGATSPFFIPNGTGTIGQVVAGCSSDASNTSFISIACNSASGTASITSAAIGSAPFLPMVFSVYGGERMRIDTAGNVLVTGGGGLGYGTGSGGTVTQLTSKSTAVTLNKPSGRIVMNDAALAAGANAIFPLINNLCGINDALYIQIIGPSSASSAQYRVSSVTGTSGVGYISVTNMTAGSLSEELVLQFMIIKGATA